MPTLIRFAKTGQEFEDVLSLRVLALEEAGRTPSRPVKFAERLVDHLDVLPSTQQVITYRQGEKSGAIRAAPYFKDEKLQNWTFDWKESRQALKGSCFYLDMLALRKNVAADTVVLQQMIRLMLTGLANQNVAHVFFNAPETMKDLVLSLGFRAISSARKCELVGMNVIPCAIRVVDFYNAFTSGLVDQELLRFQEAFYFAIFEAGEVMAVQGEKGATAYLLEQGEVEVLLDANGELIPLTTLTAGQMIGEIAMLTSEARTASLMAKTKISCLAFDRSQFLKLMYDEPHRSLDIFKIFSKRLKESNKKIAELRK
jgi:hypothetical protein